LFGGFPPFNPILVTPTVLPRKLSEVGVKLSGFGWEVDRASCPTEVVDSLKFSGKKSSRNCQGITSRGRYFHTVGTPSDRPLGDAVCPRRWTPRYARAWSPGHAQAKLTLPPNNRFCAAGISGTTTWKERTHKLIFLAFMDIIFPLLL